MKKYMLYVLPLVIIVMTSSILSDNGKAGKTGSPGELTCIDCHSDFTPNTAGGSISISNTGMTNWQYSPGQTYTITVTVARTGSSLFGLGVECLTAANANAGIFTITNTASTQLKTATVNGVIRTNVVHQLNGGAAANTKSFSFNWTAPVAGTGTVKFYYAGIAANNNGNEAGDYVYNGSQNVTELICTPPAAIPVVNGPAAVCKSASVVYSVAAVANASSYTWSLPAGWTGTSSTNSITAVAGAGSGNITVTAVNACGNSTKSLAVSTSPSVPSTPGTISGPASNNCGVSTKIYSVAAVPNATGYIWRTDIAGATLNGMTGSVSTTGPSINLTFPANFADAKIYVKAQNACGSGLEKSKTLSSKPAKPAAITGPTAPCTNTNNVAYSIAPVSGATSYSWVVPSTGMIHVSGQGSTNLLVNTKASAVACTLKVGSVNGCGTSAKRSLPLNLISCIREYELANNSFHFDKMPEKISVYNLEGRLISTCEKPSTEWSYSDLPAGIYIVRMQYPDHFSSEKIMTGLQ
ncbi:MAG: T9SS type A sorting domain-containing protein [Bacteroidia bacterium]|nr:T9SS type A sorting domain-containing protein [Bacteroidia bacterium]